MTYNNYDDKQISMEHGDEWYFDEFGEYRQTNMLQDDGIVGEEIIPDDLVRTQTPLSTKVEPEDEFNETLQSEHIEDQLNDPTLHQQAEGDYGHDHKGFFEKIKDKYDDITGR